MTMQKNKGILTVVSGFSGAGKGTIMKALMQAHSETYALSISRRRAHREPGSATVSSIFSRAAKRLSR